MKTLIGKIVLGVSDRICKPLILWSSGAKKTKLGYQFSPGYSLRREFAVERAEKFIRRQSNTEAATDLIALAVIGFVCALVLGFIATAVGILLSSLLAARLIFLPRR